MLKKRMLSEIFQLSKLKSSAVCTSVLMFAKQDTLYPLEKDMIGIGACLQNILLAATEKQYGSCIIGELYGRQNELSEHIKLECKDYLLVCGIALGKIKLVSKDIRKKKLSDFVLDTIQ